MPNLFLIRHAIAEDREVFKKTGQPDDNRPLTKDGQLKMEKIARKLFSLEPGIKVFYQSPLTRSQQTVDVLRKQYITSKVKTLSSLSPDSSMDALLVELQQNLQFESALVGHENHISQSLNYLLTGKSLPSPFAFKKGGIACLEFKKVEAGAFKLKWIVTPKIFLSDM